jgi:hypothetical protein
MGVEEVRITIVESPYSSPDRLTCVRYACWACFDCVLRGEAFYASHLLVTQILPETKASREIGLQMRDRMAKATMGLIAQYTDLGITPGMVRDVACTAVVEQRQLAGLVRAGWKRGEWPNGSVRLGLV